MKQNSNKGRFAAIGDLVGENRLKDALNALLEIIHGTAAKQEILLLLSRYHELIGKDRMGAIEFENLDISMNKIRFAILDILRELEEEYEKGEDFQKAFDTFLAKKKAKGKVINKGNIVINNNQGTIGDVFLGDKINN